MENEIKELFKQTTYSIQAKITNLLIGPLHDQCTREQSNYKQNKR